jgi:HrpA-like RNA helicase
MRAVEKVLPAKSAEVLPLHANLSSADQSKIFKRTTRRKIIVATNVAETSITVDDVVFVIDTGRVKETRFDPANGLQLLVEDWNSLAGARQRRGRAGRVKPGQCWKLFTRWQEARLPTHAQPEILRSPLPSLVLQVKALRGEEDVAAFLGKALDPPHVLAIAEALNTLTRLGALQEGDPKTAKLTPLGQNLTLLPLDLRLGKVRGGLPFACQEPG